MTRPDASMDWIELARVAPERVLAEVFWEGVDETVVAYGSVYDREALAEVSGVLLQQLEDPAAVRAPADTLGSLLAREMDESAEWVVRDAVVSRLDEAVTDPDVSAAKLEELVPLVPHLVDAGQETECDMVRDAALTAALGVAVRAMDLRVRDFTITLLRELFPDAAIETAENALPVPVPNPRSAATEVRE